MGAILAPIAGAVLGGIASRPRGSTTSVQTAEPWSGVQKPLRSLYDAALDNFQHRDPQFFPGSTVAPQGRATQAAHAGLFSRATQGNPLLGAGQQHAADTLSGRFFGENPATAGLQDTASGSMLNANPHLDAMFKQASGAVGEEFRKNVMPGVASMFSAGGRFGSNQMNESMGQAQGRYGDALGNLATSIYGGNFARERMLQEGARAELGNQFQKERFLQSQAMGLAPDLANADYFDLGQLANLGSAQDTYSQSQVDAERERWDFNQNAPEQELAFLNSILSGAAPYASQTGRQSGGQHNPIMAALGGASIGNSIFQMQNKPAQTTFSGTALAPFFYGRGTSGD